MIKEKKQKTINILLAAALCIMLSFSFHTRSYAATAIGSNMIDNCEPYDTKHCTWYLSSEGKTFDMCGNTYTDGMVFRLGYTGSSDGGIGYAYFNFKGQYESMSFEAGFVENETRNANFKIEIDGREIENTTLHYGDLAKPYTLDLKGAYQVKLTFESGGYSGSYWGIGNVQLTSNKLTRDILVKTKELKLSTDNPSAYIETVIVPKDAANQNIIYTSSNEEIAIVDEKGLVTGVGGGSATITATASNGATDKCEVTVDMPFNLAKGSISLPQSDFIYTGNPITPTVSVSYGSATLSNQRDYTVTYSNNQNAGTALVTVNGTGKYQGTLQQTFNIQKAAQEITVPYQPSSISKGTKLSLNCVAKTKCKYASSNPSILKVNGKGEVKALKKGSAVITVKAPGSKNYKAAKKVKIKFTVQ